MIGTDGSAVPLSRRHLLAGAGLAGSAVLTGLAFGAPATAAAPRARTRVPVVVTRDGLTAPAAVPAGPVTFEVTTPVAAGTAALLVRLRVPLAKYLDDLARLAAASTTAEKIEATLAVERDVVNLGGAVLVSDRPVAFTVDLSAGGYHLIAFEYTNSQARPAAHALTVRPAGGCRPPCADARIVQSPRGFVVPGDVLPASGTYAVMNRSGLLNEAVLLPVRAGTTQADVDAFFAALRDGQAPPSSPLAGRPVGVAPLSPGQRAWLTPGLPAGPYLLASWITSTVTGSPRSFEGYYRLITLR